MSSCRRDHGRRTLKVSRNHHAGAWPTYRTALMSLLLTMDSWTPGPMVLERAGSDGSPCRMPPRASCTPHILTSKWSELCTLQSMCFDWLFVTELLQQLAHLASACCADHVGYYNSYMIIMHWKDLPDRYHCISLMICDWQVHLITHQIFRSHERKSFYKSWNLSVEVP